MRVAPHAPAVAWFRASRAWHPALPRSAAPASSAASKQHHRKLILSLPMPLGLSSTTDMVTPQFINSRIRDHVLRNAEPLYVAA